ncbi:MAG: ferredoxin [Gemmatimonadota bacterium]
MHAPPGAGLCRVHGLTLRIDRDLCVGFADCCTVAPEAFDLDEEGIAVFRGSGEVPRARLLEACAACPVDAITVSDGAGVLLVP